MRLIDADALKAVFEEKSTEAVCGVKLCKAIIFRIDEAPTVDAVPVKHGKFIGTEYDGYADGSPVYYEWKCSECGYIFEDDEPTYNYCPNCGARMDKE